MRCFACDRHRDLDAAVPGGAVWDDGLVVVSHLPLATPAGRVDDDVYLGRLLVEPRRHVEGLEQLSEDEAASLGRAARAAGAALTERGGAEHVYAFLISDLVRHTHLHLVPRYPGTPREHWGLGIVDWPDAPRGDAAAVAAFVGRLRA